MASHSVGFINKNVHPSDIIVDPKISRTKS